VPSIEENLGWARSEAWADHGEEWSSGFGDTFLLWHGFLLPRFGRHLPCRRAVEIACGHGRITRFLAPRCDHLVAIDLAEDIVESCRHRLAGHTNIRYAVNDGRSLPGVEDASVDLVVSWDSLVHAEQDVLDSYVHEIARTLAPGGVAFIHHSNLGAFAHEIDQATLVSSEHWRARTATAAAVRATAAASGLACTTQELIPWGGAEYIDCFSLLVRPTSEELGRETVVVEHPDFLAEAAMLRRLLPLYGEGHPER
jgi:SAM-dependent methyltransferase